MKGFRTPTPAIRVCGHCRREYVAFRRTSRFCEALCRSRARKASGARQEALERANHHCEECQIEKPQTKLFVRHDPRFGDRKRVLCGHHTGLLSWWKSQQHGKRKIKARLENLKTR